MTLTVSVIIVWLLIGLVIGALARLLVPGRQHIGIIMTIVGTAAWYSFTLSPNADNGTKNMERLDAMTITVPQAPL